MIDNYSTLYAIRRPGVEPGIDPRQVSVQRLTAEYFQNPPPEPVAVDDQSVVIDVDGDGEVVLREMPSMPGG
jgi:hypothetical protein